MKALVSGCSHPEGESRQLTTYHYKGAGKGVCGFCPLSIHSNLVKMPWSIFGETLHSVLVIQSWLWNLATPIRVIQSIIIFDENDQGISLSLLKRKTFLFSVGSLTVRIYTWWPSCLPTCPRMKKTQRKAELRVKMANIPDVVWVHRPDCAWSQHFYGVTNLNEYKA